MDNSERLLAQMERAINIAEQFHEQTVRLSAYASRLIFSAIHTLERLSHDSRRLSKYELRLAQDTLKYLYESKPVFIPIGHEWLATGEGLLPAWTSFCWNFGVKEFARTNVINALRANPELITPDLTAVELMNWPDEKLLALPGVGPKSLESIRQGAARAKMLRSPHKEE
jgi:hypothetical protein